MSILNVFEQDGCRSNSAQGKFAPLSLDAVTGIYGSTTVAARILRMGVDPHLIIGVLILMALASLLTEKIPSENRKSAA